MLRTQIYLSKEQHSFLERLAKEMGTSISALIRQTINEHLKEYPLSDPIFQLADMEATGDVPDVSERHDEYIARAILKEE